MTVMDLAKVRIKRNKITTVSKRERSHWLSEELSLWVPMRLHKELRCRNGNPASLIKFS